MRKTRIQFYCLVCYLFMITAEPSTIYAARSEVVPIDWKAFDVPYPSDTNANLEKLCLNYSMKYYTTNWWTNEKKYADQTGTYLTLTGSGVPEYDYRPPASVAFSEAIALKLGLYDSTITGVSPSVCREHCLKLTRSVAYRHKANSSGGWGDHWQSAYWAALGGTAGWLMWDQLSITDREYVRKMVEWEANRFNNREPDYASSLGTLLTDTKAEENAWNVVVVCLAYAMMPNHANAATWRYRACQWSISAYARPFDDTANTTVVNGKPVRDWIDGHNIKNDGVLYNHSIMHPDYINSIVISLTNVCVYTAAGLQVPDALIFNADFEYNVLVSYDFKTADGWAAPGGTIYREDTDTLYWPQGTDWGKMRRAGYMALDAIASAFVFDSLAPLKGSYWEILHGNGQKRLQERHSDGHTYADASEDSYPGREEWVTAHGSALGCFAHWAKSQTGFTFTNAHYDSIGVTSTLQVGQKPLPTIKATQVPSGILRILYTGITEQSTILVSLFTLSGRLLKHKTFVPQEGTGIIDWDINVQNRKTASSVYMIQVSSRAGKNEQKFGCYRIVIIN